MDDDKSVFRKTMSSYQIEQKQKDALPKPTTLAPGDDGFQILSATLRGRTLSPEQLENLHEARLLGDLLNKPSLIQFKKMNENR